MTDTTGKLSARDLIFNLIDAADDVSPPSSNEVTADLIAAILGVGDLAMDEVREALRIYRQLRELAERSAPENVKCSTCGDTRVVPTTNDTTALVDCPDCTPENVETPND